MTPRNRWMAGKTGLMVHYLPPEVYDRQGRRVSGLEEAAACFDTDRFLADFDATGADHLIFTLGQNSGWYNSPNAVIDRYAGPGHCMKRDIVGEIAAGVKKLGKRFIAYLPSEIRGNTTLHAGFGWNDEPDTPQLLFQQRWQEAIACWANSFGELLDGWWFDGCYDWPAFNNRFVQWDKWYAAARSGNPDALITFNDGCFVNARTLPIREEFDYFAGEATMLWEGLPRLGGNPAGFAPEAADMSPGSGVLSHLLVSVDAFWCHNYDSVNFNARTMERWPHTSPKTLSPGEMEPPAYTDDELRTARDAFCGVGGAVTFNVGIYVDGSLGERTVAQLGRVLRQK